MKRVLIFIGLVLAANTAARGADHRLPPEVLGFLKSREVVATIEFGEGETRLDAGDKQTLDRIAGRLKRLDPLKTLVRIEGMSSVGGGDHVNIPISMSRAQAVMDYLKENHHFTADLSMTGFGSGSLGSLKTEPGCRAEIAFYDNPWEMPGVTVEKVTSK